MNSRFRISTSDELLTEKEVAFVCKWSRTKIWRRKKEGLPIVDGRISLSRLAWWMEQHDAAKRLKMKVNDFLTIPRRRREKLLATKTKTQG